MKPTLGLQTYPPEDRMERRDYFTKAGQLRSYRLTFYVSATDKSCYVAADSCGIDSTFSVA